MAEQGKVATNDERAMRRAKRQALIDGGLDPYPIASHVTAHVAQLARDYADLESGQIAPDEAVCTVAGRIRAYRGHGKLLFMDLEDATGRIQLFCRVNNLSEAAWELAGQLDVGDIVEATGVPTRTRRGEFSLMTSDLTLLSKSLRPLPEKFHGLSDREVRYRQRYVDLIMNPEVRQTFVKRSRLISAIRRHMEDQGYLEVETPILQETLGGANARPFTTHFNVLDQDCYLRIATELHLKRCIVGGMERVFEVGRQFRNEGMDLTHNPEFTSMEAYCAYGDLGTMKQLSEGLFQACAAAVGKGDVIEYQGQQVNLASPWRSAPMSELVSEVLGEELSIDTPVEHLREVLTANELEWEPGWGAGKLIFELYDELVEKTLVNPTFVCDYPVEVSPLAKRRADDPRLTDRFELVICGKEYANAFSELNDPVDQEGRFAAQVEAKAAGDDEAMDYDYDYVRALEYGMPPAGGIGFGIDRMVMLFCDQPAIRDVLLFPHLRPEKRKDAPTASPARDEGQAPAVAEASAVAGGQSPAITTAGAPESASVSAPGTEPAAVQATDASAGAQTDAKVAASKVADAQVAASFDPGITREQAYELLCTYNKDPFHVSHGETLEGLMRYYAEQEDPEHVDFWGIVGLLHDLDWEMWPDPVQHTIKTAELLAEAGANPALAHSIQTHNSDMNPDLPKPEHIMEKWLWATDELSGLIQACVKMRPSRSVMDFNVKSLRKKYKAKSFAAGCNREVIAKGADLLGMELGELFGSVIDAMKAIAPVGDIYAQ